MPSNLPDLTPSMSKDMRKRIVRRLAEIARTAPGTMAPVEVSILAEAVIERAETCRNGHPMIGENVATWRGGNGYQFRACRAYNCERAKRWRADNATILTTGRSVGRPRNVVAD